MFTVKKKASRAERNTNVQLEENKSKAYAERGEERPNLLLNEGKDALGI